MQHKKYADLSCFHSNSFKSFALLAALSQCQPAYLALKTPGAQFSAFTQSQLSSAIILASIHFPFKNSRTALHFIRALSKKVSQSSTISSKNQISFKDRISQSVKISLNSLILCSLFDARIIFFIFLRFNKTKNIVLNH